MWLALVSGTVHRHSQERPSEAGRHESCDTPSRGYPVTSKYSLLSEIPAPAESQPRNYTPTRRVASTQSRTAADGQEWTACTRATDPFRFRSHQGRRCGLSAQGLRFAARALLVPPELRRSARAILFAKRVRSCGGIPVIQFGHHPHFFPATASGRGSAGESECFPSYARNQFAFDGFLCHQAHRPTGAAFRRTAAYHCNQTLFLAFVEHFRCTRPLSFIQCPLQTALLVTAANIAYGLGSERNHGGNLRCAGALRADATIDSHWSNRIVPGGQGRMSFDDKAADVLWMG